MIRNSLKKRIFASVLSIVLIAAAPMQCYRVESRAAVVEAVALSAATIAVMYLAACGISYIFDGVDGSSAKEYVEEEIRKFSVIQGSGPPIDPDDNFKIGKNGGIILNLELMAWMAQFAEYVKGNMGNNQIMNVGGTGETARGFTVINETTYDLNIDNSYDFVDSYLIYYDTLDVNQKITIGSSGEIQAHCYGKTSSIAYISFTRMPQDIAVATGLQSASYTYSSGSVLTRANTIAYNKADGKFHCVAMQGYGTDPGVFQKIKILRDGFTFGDEDVNIESGQNISKKTGTVNIPDPDNVPDGDGMEIKQPNGVPIINININGVPQPLSDSDIWDNIMNRIAENSATQTAYNPTYNTTNNYNEYININTQEYDEPLTEEEIDDLEAVGDLDGAKKLMEDAINWFLELFPWQQMKTKFPFSIPYDMWLLLSTFHQSNYDVLSGQLPTSDRGGAKVMRKAGSDAPVYVMQVPFMKNPNGDGWTTGTVTVDLSALDPIRGLVRAAAGILFTAILLLFIV